MNMFIFVIVRRSMSNVVVWHISTYAQHHNLNDR